MRSAAEGTFAHWMTGDEGDSSLGAVRRFGRLGVQEEEQARSCLACLEEVGVDPHCLRR